MEETNNTAQVEATAIETTVAPIIAPETAQQPTGQWFDSIKDDGMRGYVEAKGYKGVEDIITQQQNYEKLISAEKAGNTLIMPGADATPEQLSEFYNKLGRPAKAEEYGLDKMEGSNPEFSAQVQNWMHELGLNKTQATALAEKYNGYAASQVATMQQHADVERQNAEQSLKQEWAQNYDRNIELSRRAARAAGIDDAKAGTLERAFATNPELVAMGGVGFLAKMFNTFGSGLSEHRIAGTGGNASPFGLSLEGAKAELQGIMGDASKREKYLSGDAQTRERVLTLNRVIAGSK